MENIIENNKLIAEFLNWEFDDLSETFETPFLKLIDPQAFGDEQFSCKLKDFELEFHSDWNWLMEVVEKIEKEFCSTNIHYYSQKQMYSVEFLGFNIEYDKSEYGDDKMKILYNSCVKFINFYNKQKEE